MGDGRSAEHDAQVGRLEHEISMLLRRSRTVLRSLAASLHPDVDAGSYAVRTRAVTRRNHLHRPDLTVPDRRPPRPVRVARIV